LKGDKMSNWDSYFLKIAELVSTKSKDRSTKVGAVITGPDNEIRSTGYNGFCRGFNDNIDCRHERPIKYSYTEHAERNALYNASRAGICTKGCTLYLNFSLYPCPDCARGIIQSGIIRVVGYKDKPFSGKGDFWKESFKISKEMFDECGVIYEECEVL
jgi:dCMP deaminase